MALGYATAGKDYVFIPFLEAVGGVLVAKGNAAQSLADLKGSKVGIAGGPLDKSWLILRAYAEQHDFLQQLSLGQQRRLSLARAFVVKPDLLLMDEPFVSLDSSLVEDMIALFQRLQHGHRVATILVTHFAAGARCLADQIITLSGRPAPIMGDDPSNGEP